MYMRYSTREKTFDRELKNYPDSHSQRNYAIRNSNPKCVDIRFALRSQGRRVHRWFPN